jgi:hypothetical protein
MRPRTISVGLCRSTLLPILVILGSHPARVTFASGRQAGTTVLRVPANDHITPHHLAGLAARSATARDLLTRVELVPDAVFIVRAHPRLIEDARLLGRGRFWIVRGHLFGLLEYQAEPAGSLRAERVLAHELAHALEVGILPRDGGTRGLRSMLQVCKLDEDFDPAPGIETDFARAVSHRVHLELLGRLPNVTDLGAQAARSHVALPPQSGSGEP